MDYVLVKDANGFFSQITEEEFNRQKEDVLLPKNEVKLVKPTQVEVKKTVVKK